MTTTESADDLQLGSDAEAVVVAEAQASTSRSGGRGAGRNTLAIVLPPLLLGAAIIGLWYFVSYGLLDESRRFLLEPPHEVLRVGFLEWENFSEILSGLWSSAKVAFVGLCVAILIGLVLATLMSQAKYIERAVFPYAVTVQAVPVLAIVPVIGFWFGFGFTSRVIVCVIIALFPIIVNTLFGLQSVDRGMHDLFTLHRASRLTRLRKLMFPNAMPAVFAGLRISAGLSVIGAIVGDFFFGQGERGIGQLIQRYANFLEGEQLIAAVIMSSALGVVVFQFFGWLQRVVVGRWAQADIT
ncbi:MAG: ABC transporter permease [Actinomycetota bacterium]